MADFKKIKSRIKRDSKPSIEFTPEELRELRDPTTAIGAVLNPPKLLKARLDRPSEAAIAQRFPGQRATLGAAGGSGADILGKFGKYPSRSLMPGVAKEESEQAIADAYLKAAEKKGVISPEDDRISQIYETLGAYKKEKGLEDVPIKESAFSSSSVSGGYVPQIDQIMLEKKITPLSSLEKKQNEYLNTVIHELMHAKQARELSPKEKKQLGKRGHFYGAPYVIGEEEEFGEAGPRQEVLSAALERLQSMGREKK